jgi:hypothetical protein
MSRKEAYFFHEAARPDGIRTRSPPTTSSLLKNRRAHRNWKPLPADEMEMWLHGEPEIGRLHPKGLSDALDFRCHSALVFECEQMLDYGIAENYVDASFTELSEIRRVSGERPNICVSLLFCDKV